MAAQTTPQLVRLAEVADTLGCAAGFVQRAAGKDVHEWWTGELAVTFDVARRIAERWAAAVADAEAETRRAVAEQAAQVEREDERYRREQRWSGRTFGAAPPRCPSPVPLDRAGWETKNECVARRAPDRVRHRGPPRQGERVQIMRGADRLAA